MVLVDLGVVEDFLEVRGWRVVVDKVVGAGVVEEAVAVVAVEEVVVSVSVYCSGRCPFLTSDEDHSPRP